MPLAPEGRLAIPALMLSLLLLRHAKSSWKNSALQDFERPLAPRGKRAAPRVGAYMAAQGLSPDLVLSSTAVRARQTLDLVLPHLSGAPRIEYEGGLYLATSADLLSRLRELKSAARAVMIVGHNPGMQGLAVSLAHAGDGKMRKELAAKFPTAALAVIGFKAPDWSKVAPATGTLTHFMAPKRLP